MCVCLFVRLWHKYIYNFVICIQCAVMNNTKQLRFCYWSKSMCFKLNRVC